MKHALEVSERSATLYLSGALSAADAFPLRRICREIPVCVRTLRLDLHGVAEIDDGAMETVRAIVRYWKHSRGGSFRLSIASANLIATVSASASRIASASLAAPSVTSSPAMTGMYL
jgi:ABC-type transporter Mla MlaB component